MNLSGCVSRAVLARLFLPAYAGHINPDPGRARIAGIARIVWTGVGWLSDHWNRQIDFRVRADSQSLPTGVKSLKYVDVLKPAGFLGEDGVVVHLREDLFACRVLVS